MSSPTGLSARVAVNAPLLAASRLLSAVTGVVALGVSARYLGPDAFGALTAATLFVSLMGVFCDVGLYLVAAREVARSPDAARDILRSTLALGFVASICTAAVAFAVALLVFSGSENALTRDAVLLLGVNILVAAPVGTVGAWLVAHERAWITQAVPAAGALVTLLALIAVAAADLGFTGVVVAYAVASVVNALALAVLAWRHRYLRPAVDLEIWRRLLSLAVPQAALIILSVVYLRADGLLLAWLGSAREVALYGVAFKVVEVLTALAAQFALVLFPAIARLEPGDERLTAIMGKALSTFHVIVLPMVVLGTIFAPAAALAIGGSDYLEAGSVLAILMPAVGLIYYKALFGNALVALGRQRRLVRYSLGVAVFNVALNIALIPALGVHGAAIALLTTELVALGAMILLYREAAPAPPLEGLGRLIPAGGLLAATAALGALGASELGTIAGAGLGTAAALLVYGWVLHRSGAVPPELTTALATLGRRVRRA